MTQIKLLIIDNNPESVIKLLKQNNYKILYSEDIIENSLIIENNQIDLIISSKEENLVIEELLKNRRDGLTNIYNKDYFLKKTEDYKGVYSIIMIDIDDFKKVNDTYGHLIGDIVLKEVAARLEYSLRKEDLLARFGGDEFIIFLPTTIDNALIVAERLRKYIMQEKFHKNNIDITASFGIAQFEANDKLHEIIHKADQGLYQAKKAGKNKIICV